MVQVSLLWEFLVEVFENFNLILKPKKFLIDIFFKICQKFSIYDVPGKNENYPGMLETQKFSNPGLGIMCPLLPEKKFIFNRSSPAYVRFQISVANVVLLLITVIEVENGLMYEVMVLLLCDANYIFYVSQQQYHCLVHFLRQIEDQ